MDRAAPRSAALKVLVIDDEVDIATTTAELIRLLGHDALPVTDPTEALRTAAEFRPDVVFLDIGMPRMSGYDVASLLKANFPQLHVVAITAYGAPDARERARKSGFDAHLTKPADLDLIRTVLAHIAEGGARPSG